MSTEDTHTTTQPAMMSTARAALVERLSNTLVSMSIIGAVTFLAADHILQVGTVSAIFVTLIAHQFGTFTIGRRGTDSGQ